MSNETRIIRSNGKCTPPNNNNANCDCAIEKFENNNDNKNSIFGVSNQNNIFIYLLKFGLITFFIYLVFSTLTK
jgi:hypothetical protein